MSISKTEALAALDETAAELADVQAKREDVMKRIEANILAADRAGVPRMTIVKRSGVSLRTAYKILPRKEQL